MMAGTGPRKTDFHVLLLRTNVITTRKQRRRVESATDLKSGGPEFKSRPEH